MDDGCIGGEINVIQSMEKRRWRSAGSGSGSSNGSSSCSCHAMDKK